ncbi:fibronectin type III domain-containing protein [Catellatospora vulcania]|uniref:fibronectin type III domain-containing protein n=1 Tax=Catellatospora vulcania TaxID=1460450 RepID=UPI0012D42B01|nr:fibronectin type III domain-containing protein [Catellatospora vulcania]
MAQPWLAEAQLARSLIMTLGATLDDVVSGRSGLEVHQVLIDAFDAPHDDSRIDGVEVGRDEFMQLWTGVQQGLRLPESAWQKIVLPAVITFSGPRVQKIHLELATAQWLAARAAVDAVPGYAEIAATLGPAARPAQDDGAGEPWAGGGITVRPSADTTLQTAEIPRASGVRSRAWAVAAVVVVAAASVFALSSRTPETPSGAAAGTPTASGSTAAVVVAGSSMQPSALPTVLASAMRPPSAITDQPPPVSVSAGPASRPPSAPRDLAAMAATHDSVMLSWSVPADVGTGGVAYYRIVQDGADAGWTRSPGATVTGLAAGTRYIFVIVAYNAAGQQSPPSSAVTVVTAGPAASVPPSVAPPSSPGAPPSPPPSPSPPVVLPGSDVTALGGTVRVTCSNRQPAVVRVTPAAGYTVRDVPQPKDQVRILLVSPDNDSEITARCDKNDVVAATVKEHSH